LLLGNSFHSQEDPSAPSEFSSCLLSTLGSVATVPAFSPLSLDAHSLTFIQYWDSITKEDLEFSVGTKQGNWELKEQLLPDDDRRTAMYQDANSEYASSTHHRNSVYGGGY